MKKCKDCGSYTITHLWNRNKKAWEIIHLTECPICGCKFENDAVCVGENATGITEDMVK